MADWTGRRVLITGVCGTVGAEILRQLIPERPEAIIGIDNNESDLFFVEQAYRDKHPGFGVALADVRDAPSLHRIMDGVDVVLHAAALKHDKAVNPTSVMGTSKLMGERLITAADLRRPGKRPIFASTRFGNVLGSRGSVIPLFHRQIQAGGPVTLTDPDMTRFIMTLQEAVRLTMDSVFLARGGEVFVTKMPVLRIDDLAAVMVEELAPLYGHDPAAMAVETVGTRPGEKLYEELLNEEEVRRAREVDSYFIIAPALGGALGAGAEAVEGAPVTEAYNSSNQAAMTREELSVYLETHGLLDVDGGGNA
jgi:FlaA1/EpsC-like NDP-sugar epimerase